MEKLTEERAKELHIQMWTGLRDSGGYKYQSETCTTHNPLNGCFMCEFCIDRELSESTCLVWDCDKCLVEWIPGNKSLLTCACEDDESPYDDWRSVDTTDNRKKFAQKILDLPWRKSE